MQEEGYPGLVVHGPLTAFLLMDMVRQQAKQTVKAFSFRGLAPLFDLAAFVDRCRRSIPDHVLNGKNRLQPL